MKSRLNSKYILVIIIVVLAIGCSYLILSSLFNGSKLYIIEDEKLQSEVDGKFELVSFERYDINPNSDIPYDDDIFLKKYISGWIGKKAAYNYFAESNLPRTCFMDTESGLLDLFKPEADIPSNYMRETIVGISPNKNMLLFERTSESNYFCLYDVESNASMDILRVNPSADYYSWNWSPNSRYLTAIKESLMNQQVVCELFVYDTQTQSKNLYKLELLTKEVQSYVNREQLVFSSHKKFVLNNDGQQLIFIAPYFTQFNDIIPTTCLFSIDLTQLQDNAAPILLKQGMSDLRVMLNNNVFVYLVGDELYIMEKSNTPLQITSNVTCFDISNDNKKIAFITFNKGISTIYAAYITPAGIESATPLYKTNLEYSIDRIQWNQKGDKLLINGEINTKIVENDTSRIDKGYTNYIMTIKSKN